MCPVCPAIVDGNLISRIVGCGQIISTIVQYTNNYFTIYLYGWSLSYKHCCYIGWTISDT